MYFVRKIVAGRERVYIYYRKDGKVRAVPRSLTKQYDGAEDHNVRAWITANAPKYEGSRHLSDQATLYSDDKLSLNINAYHNYLLGVEKRSLITANKQASWLRRYVAQFFLSLDPPLKDPNSWPGASVRMFEYLKNTHGCTDDLIREINNAARKFYTFLGEEGVVAPGLTLRLRRAAKVSKDTPLKFSVSPDDVLRFARSVPAKYKNIRWLALLGYFFSLRPQESFVLAPEAFLAGSEVLALDRGKAMTEAGLFDRLAVEITKQRSNHGTVGAPKSHSKGWVVCFSKDAAQLIVGMLNELPDLQASFLKLKNRELYKQWREHGMPGVTLKDLRRASIYWLGHNTDLRPLDLQKHARHKSFSTTEQYLRQPGQNVVRTPGKFDLGA